MSFLIDHTAMKLQQREALRIHRENKKIARQQEIMAKRLIWQKQKAALQMAIDAESPQDIFNWCYCRALMKHQERAAKNMVAFGVHVERLDDDTVEQIQKNWHRWYYRICKWWNIDHGMGEAH